MKNYAVSILNKKTREHITTYTIEDDSDMIARMRGIGKFRREHEEYKNIDVIGIAKESTRTIVPLQEPKKWEYI